MGAFNVWADAFSIALAGVGAGFIEFVPRFVLAILAFVVGWIFAKLVSKGIQSLSKSSKFESLFEQAGVSQSFSKTGLRFSAGKLIGEVVRWCIVIVFLIPTLEILGLSEITSLLKSTAQDYLLKVVLAALVLVIATVIADFLGTAVSASARAADVKSANTLGGIVKYLVWIFAFLIAFTELGIAANIIYILLIGIVAMFALGGAIAIGLGGKDIASDMIRHLREEFRPRR